MRAAANHIGAPADEVRHAADHPPPSKQLLGCGEGDKGLSQAICTYHVTDFSLPDLAGRPHRVREYLDRGPVLLYFFTSWCPFCRSEIPQLKQIERERDALGVRLVAIGAGLNDTVETVRRYAVQHRLPYVVLYDDESAVSLPAAGAQH